MARNLEDPGLAAMAAVLVIVAPGVTLTVAVEQNALVALPMGVVVIDAVSQVTGGLSAAETDGAGRTADPLEVTGRAATVRGEVGTTAGVIVLGVSDRVMIVHGMGGRAGKIGARARVDVQRAAVEGPVGTHGTIGEISVANGVMSEDPAESSRINETVVVPLDVMTATDIATIAGVHPRTAGDHEKTVEVSRMIGAVRESSGVTSPTTVGVLVGSFRMIGAVRANRVAISPRDAEDRGMSSVGTGTLVRHIAVEVAATTEMIVGSAMMGDVMTAEAHVTTGLSLAIDAVGAARGTTVGSAVMIAARNALFLRVLSDVKMNHRCLR